MKNKERVLEIIKKTTKEIESSKFFKDIILNPESAYENIYFYLAEIYIEAKDYAKA